MAREPPVLGRAPANLLTRSYRRGPGRSRRARLTRVWSAGHDGHSACGLLNPLLYSPVFRCSLVAVAAAGLLLPQGFSRCCPQPGYRSGCDQG